MNNSVRGNRLPIGTVLEGKELGSFLLAGIEAKEHGIIAHVSQFDGQDLFGKWQKLIRCIEEFINLRFELTPQEWHLLERCDIDILQNKHDFQLVIKMVSDKYGTDVAERIKRIVIMYYGMKSAYRVSNVPGMDFRNIAEAISFCQSRRLYYVAYLSLIRLYAKGSQRVPFMKLLFHFQYQIDMNMASITTGLHAVMGSRCLEGYYAVSTELGLQFNIQYNQLEDFFLEPHVMSEVDIIEHENDDSYKDASSCIQRKLYSYSELEYSVKQAESIYKGYGIAGSRTLQEIKVLVQSLKDKFVEDYSVTLSETEFGDLVASCHHLNLCSDAIDYYGAINERPAFFPNNGSYYSTVFLLVRFVENTVYGLLRKNMRYRIKAGFVFEKKITTLLEQYGFESTKVKRIRKQEFDVICHKKGKAYNFQCKNNYLDINTLSPDNIDKVSRQNKRLTNYYLKALDKEDARIQLIKEYFKTDEVENYVISRFPIMMNHERLITFNRLEEHLKKTIDKEV